MKKYFFLLLILPLISFQGLHKFYVSVTEIEHNSEAQTLQIISRVFTDDMENLLKTRSAEELYLTKNEEHPSADKYLQKYLSQKLEVEVDGEQYPLKYIGKKYDNDMLIFFIEVEKVSSVNRILVRNEVLTDLFPDQKNVVHVEVRDQTKSLLLSRSEESGILNFSN